MQIVKCHLVKHLVEGPNGTLRDLYQHRLMKEGMLVRRWKPCAVLDKLEAKVEFENKFQGQTDKKGLGHLRFNRNPTIAEKRKRILAGVRAEADHKSFARAMSLPLQGGWTKWVEDVCPSGPK